MNPMIEIRCNRDTPLPVDIPEMETAKDFHAWVISDTPRLIEAGVTRAEYIMANFRAVVELDHENQSGNCEIFVAV